MSLFAQRTFGFSVYGLIDFNRFYHQAKCVRTFSFKPNKVITSKRFSFGSARQNHDTVEAANFIFAEECQSALTTKTHDHKWLNETDTCTHTHCCLCNSDHLSSSFSSQFHFNTFDLLTSQQNFAMNIKAGKRHTLKKHNYSFFGPCWAATGPLHLSLIIKWQTKPTVKLSWNKLS